MAARTKSANRSKSKPRRWWQAAKRIGLRRLLLVTLASVFGLGVVSAGVFGFQRMNSFVGQLIQERTSARVTLVDLPSSLTGLAANALRESVHPLLQNGWTDAGLPRRIAHAVRETGWVSKVHYARRTGDGHFRVSCQYRIPVALVQQRSEFFSVDRDGVRLPGQYAYDPAWKLIQGVTRQASAPGALWDADELRAGLAILDAISAERFASQIVAVLVDNYGGRQNRWQTHIELATDQPGGRVRWGSAPGWEVEENSLAQKLAILRENFHRTGRVDAHYLQIDVSTLPDRFTVPG